MDDAERDAAAWNNLSVVERDHIAAIECMDERTVRLEIQRDDALEKLWLAFQTAAASLGNRK